MRQQKTLVVVITLILIFANFTLVEAASTLRIGSRGDEVKALQLSLNKLGYDISVDGIFGRETRNTVIDFQGKKGLVQDGIVGAKTHDALNKAILELELSSASANIPNGVYRIITKSMKFVDIKDGSKDNGAIAQIWQYADADNQLFRFERMNDGSYKIIPVHSGKPLEVRNSSTDDSGTVAQWEYVDGYSCKLWYVYDCGNGWYNFVNKNSGKYLDIQGGFSKNGTALQQYTANKTDAQIFGLISTTIYYGPVTDKHKFPEVLAPIFPSKSFITMAHEHKNTEFFTFIINDTSGTMYWATGYLCECGEVSSYHTLEFPN